MTLEDVRHPRCLLLEVISGSRAYGTDTPESDTDIKGVFLQPLDSWLGLHRLDQVNDEGHNVTFYELGRFAELLGKNNPNLLEMLFTPPDCVLFRHPLLDLITPEMVLSRVCFDSFAGYAATQITKARGLNKKIVNPQPETRRSAMEFCHVLDGQGSVPLADWLAARGLRQHDCGLAAVPHMPGTFGIYHDPSGAAEYRGLWSSAEATDPTLSSVPRDARPLGWMHFNKDAFKRHCREWAEYREWLTHRNEARYRGNMQHGQGYDAKNLMHTFRLLDSAEEIAREGRLNVRTRNRAWLLRVRAGEFSYDELMQRAAERVEEIRVLYSACALPEKPDISGIEAAVVQIRREFWGLPR